MRAIEQIARSRGLRSASGASDGAERARPRVARCWGGTEAVSVLQEIAVDPGLYEGYAIDLDGTMYLGVELLPGAAATIATLRALDRRIVYLSNNPSTPGNATPSCSRDSACRRRPEAIVNSSGVMVEYLQRRHPGARLFVIGEASFQGELRRGRVSTLTEDPGRTDVVVAAFDRTFDYRKLQIAFDAIRGGARLVATNPDPYCPVPGGGLPDCGAITAAIEAATGVRADAVVGKPSETMAQAALSRLGVRPAEAIVVGDRLDTDVAMGVRAGMHTALVLTGATRREHLAGRRRAAGVRAGRPARACCPPRHRDAGRTVGETGERGGRAGPAVLGRRSRASPSPTGARRGTRRRTRCRRFSSRSTRACRRSSATCSARTTGASSSSTTRRSTARPTAAVQSRRSRSRSCGGWMPGGGSPRSSQGRGSRSSTRCSTWCAAARCSRSRSRTRPRFTRGSSSRRSRRSGTEAWRSTCC